MLYHPTYAHFQRTLLAGTPAARIAAREARIAAVKSQLAKRRSTPPRVARELERIAKQRKELGV